MVAASTGIISTIAGSNTIGLTGDGGPASKATLTGPMGLAFDSAGNLYIADTDDYAIRKISTSGTISTVAGTGSVLLRRR
jgi:trimeric autotransporter adhesin